MPGRAWSVQDFPPSSHMIWVGTSCRYTTRKLFRTSDIMKARKPPQARRNTGNEISARPFNCSLRCGCKSDCNASACSGGRKPAGSGLVDRHKGSHRGCSLVHDGIHLAKKDIAAVVPPIKIRAFCVRDNASATKTPPIAVKEILICSFPD